MNFIYDIFVTTFGTYEINVKTYKIRYETE